MSVREDVKLLLAKEAVTMKSIAEKMKDRTGYPYNLKVLSDKLARQSKLLNMKSLSLSQIF